MRTVNIDKLITTEFQHNNFCYCVFEIRDNDDLLLVTVNKTKEGADKDLSSIKQDTDYCIGKEFFIIKSVLNE